MKACVKFSLYSISNCFLFDCTIFDLIGYSFKTYQSSSTKRGSIVNHYFLNSNWEPKIYNLKLSGEPDLCTSDIDFNELKQRIYDGRFV